MNKRSRLSLDPVFPPLPEWEPDSVEAEVDSFAELPFAMSELDDAFDGSARRRWLNDEFEEEAFLHKARRRRHRSWDRKKRTVHLQGPEDGPPPFSVGRRGHRPRHWKH